MTKERTYEITFKDNDEFNIIIFALSNGQARRKFLKLFNFKWVK